MWMERVYSRISKGAEYDQNSQLHRTQYYACAGHLAIVLRGSLVQMAQFQFLVSGTHPAQFAVLLQQLQTSTPIVKGLGLTMKPPLTLTQPIRST